MGKKAEILEAKIEENSDKISIIRQDQDVKNFEIKSINKQIVELENSIKTLKNLLTLVQNARQNYVPKSELILKIGNKINEHETKLKSFHQNENNITLALSSNDEKNLSKLLRKLKIYNASTEQIAQSGDIYEANITLENK